MPLTRGLDREMRRIQLQGVDRILIEIDALPIQPFLPRYSVPGCAYQGVLKKLVGAVHRVASQKSRCAQRLEVFREQVRRPVRPKIFVTVDNL